MGTCHLNEPSIPFKVVTAVTYTFDDGTTEVQPTEAAIGMIEVDGHLMTKADFDAKYTVDAPL